MHMYMCMSMYARYSFGLAADEVRGLADQILRGAPHLRAAELLERIDVKLVRTLTLETFLQALFVCWRAQSTCWPASSLTRPFLAGTERETAREARRRARRHRGHNLCSAPSQSSKPQRAGTCTHLSATFFKVVCVCKLLSKYSLHAQVD